MSQNLTGDVLTIDETKFKGDNGDVELFQWLRQLDSTLERLPKEEIRRCFDSVEKFLVKIVVGADSLPFPSRPIRHALSRCLVKLYGRNESRSLYDTLQTLLRVAGETSGKLGDRDIRVCVLYCLGELILVYGSQVMSVIADSVTLALRLFKSTAHAVLIRYHSALLVSKSVKAALKALPETVVKDLLKTFKHAIGDKAPAIQRVSFDIVVGIQGASSMTAMDIDSLLQLYIRHVDSMDNTCRAHLAHVTGSLLATCVSTSLVTKQALGQAEREGSGDGEHEDTLPESSKPSIPTISLQTVLSQLSIVLNRSSATARSRVAMVQCYASFLDGLGSVYVEANYPVIAKHLLVDIVAHPRNRVSSHEILRVRKFVGVLLGDLIGLRMLSEQGQIAAIQDLVATYLRKWPSLLPGQAGPHELTLIAVLKEVSALLHRLGNAPQFIQVSLLSPVIRLLEHPHHAVRIAAAYCLQQFCWVVPRRLQQTAEELSGQLDKGVAALLVPGSERNMQHKALGQATGLAALFALFPFRHLYVSYELCSRVLAMAIQLLKTAGEHDLALAAVEAEISWTLISALMTLGRHFVQPHLPQLLTLWRNTLARASSKEPEDLPPRVSMELAFLLHVRHCALGALYEFLRHNPALLTTLDTARRIGSTLANSLSFANSLNNVVYEDEGDAKSSLPHLQATTPEIEVMFRRRLLHCFASFSMAHISETAQAAVLDFALKVFSAPDTFKGSSLQAAIAASAGSFTSIWECNDGYAYGISSHDWLTDADEFTISRIDESRKAGQTRDAVEWSIIAQLQEPVLGSCEYEPLCLLQNVTAEERSWPEPPPPATGIVDVAIHVFGIFLTGQPIKACDRIWTIILENVRSPRLERNPGRRAAVMMNTAAALMHAFQRADRDNRSEFVSPPLYSNLVDFLRGCLGHTDEKLRKLCSAAYGLVATRLDAVSLASQVKVLVDQVLSNRDPSSRAGCALTLGSLYASLGGLAAGPLLKTIVNVLMSLGNDPHPVVHYYALQSLARVIDAASLSYEPHIRSTLGMLTKLYMSETHEPESRRYAISAGLDDLPLYAVICDIADGMVAVLGPELRDSVRLRTLLLALLQELSVEEDELVVVEAMRCLQHCLLFAREFLDVPSIVLRLRTDLSSRRTPLKASAVNGLYLLVQKDVFIVSQYGGDQLAEALFAMLDADASADGVRAILSSWLSQTVTANPSAWIALCQKIMSQANSSQQGLKAEAPLTMAPDDESQSLQRPDEPSDLYGRRIMGRWRTQLFALQCLHEICQKLSADNLREHTDLRYAKTHGYDLSKLLGSKVPELIRMAFTASTAYVTEIRLAGLVILRDVVQIFADAPDPDVEGLLLLEQYQAPIAAALTPAFSAESPPELLACAVEVCAIFIGSGVVEDGSKMGRILKLLTTALGQCSEGQQFSLGDSGQLGPNASVMLRVAVISAWAKLALSSSQRAYLTDVLQPHRRLLASLWVESIVDYARLKAYSDMTADPDELNGPEMSTSILEKDVTLQYYADSWWYIIGAVSSFMQQNDPSLHAPLNGRQQDLPLTTNGAAHGVLKGPCSLYPILLGLSCQILLADPPAGNSTKLLAEQRANTLEFLSQLMRPEFSGTDPLQRPIFEEISSLLYRFALGGPVGVLEGVLRVTGALAQRCSRVPHAAWKTSEETLHCMRVVVCILRRLSSPMDVSAYDGPSTHLGTIYVQGVETLCNMTQHLDIESHEAARAVALSTFVDLLREESGVVNSVTSSLPALRTLIAWPASQANGSRSTPHSSQAIHGLLSACVVNMEAMSGRQGPEVTMKLQNNMLAAAVTLSISPSDLVFSYPLIEQCVAVMVQHLTGDAKELSRVAAQCASMLMSATRTGPAVLRVCCRLLLPGLVVYALDLDCPNLEERYQALNSLLGVVDAAHITRTLCVILPVYVASLGPARTVASSKLGLAHILEVATTYPAAFKEATASLHASVRTVMEAALRQAMAPTVTPTLHVKRQIALKQF